MFCQACGKEIEAGTKFCKHCGAGQPAGGAPAAAVVAAGSQLVEAARGEFLRLRISERVILIGAVVAAMSWFLPLVQVGGFARLGGIQLMKVWGGVVLIVLLALFSLAVLYWSLRATPAQRILAAGLQVTTGALLGPQIIVTALLVPMGGELLGPGAWGVGLGFCAILAGGLMLLADLSRTPEAKAGSVRDPMSRSIEDREWQTDWTRRC